MSWMKKEFAEEAVRKLWNSRGITEGEMFLLAFDRLVVAGIDAQAGTELTNEEIQKGVEEWLDRFIRRQHGGEE